MIGESVLIKRNLESGRMIWSEQELANIAVGGEKVALSLVMPHLAEPENSDIFKEENFSLLWGVLGVSGVSGATEEGCEKIWQALMDNGVVDAYDKGILKEFNQKMGQVYQDNRLRAWSKMDKYVTQRFFEKRILIKLADTNENLAYATLTYCSDWLQLAENLAQKPMSLRLKAYLGFIRPVEKLWESQDGHDITMVYEKESVLRKITQTIAYQTRELEDSEKEFFYFYIKEAIESGFSATDIGFNDHVLARLMAKGSSHDMAEIEAEAWLSRHQDIMDFAHRFENKDGFYEEMAARIVHFDRNRIAEMVDRCLKLIEKQEHPRGVLFALELVNLNQVKSAMTILLNLAQKGQATEMTSFLHRLLPKASGAEDVILDVLMQNIRQQKQYVRENALTRELIVQHYLQAARSYIDAGLFKQSATILLELAQEQWLDDTSELLDKFIWLTNWLLMKDKEAGTDLLTAASNLGLAVLSEDDMVAISKERDGSFKAIQQKLLQTIKTGLFDEKPSRNEPEYETVEPSETMPEKLEAVEQTVAEQDNQEKAYEGRVEGIENRERVPSELPSEIHLKESSNNAKGHKVNLIDEHKKEDKIEDSKAPMAAASAENKEGEQETLAEVEQGVTQSIQSWENEEDEKTGTFAKIKNKININNILNIKSKDVDKQFDKIKKLTKVALDKANQVKLRASETNEQLKQSTSVQKIRQIADKIKFFKKKQ